MSGSHLQRSASQRRPAQTGRFAVAVALFSAGSGLADDAAVLPLSVSARNVSAPPARVEPMAAADAPVLSAPTQPTLPDARLPQYQLDSPLTGALADNPSRQSPLRFQLALPARPLVVEATIRIDGQPFQTARRRRIEAIIEAVAKSVASDAAASQETATESSLATEPSELAAASPADGVGESPAESQSTGAEGAEDPEETNSGDAPSTPAYRAASTDEEIAARYFAATGTDVSADAIRWLLTTRVDGPPLLMLNDRFQRFRSDQRPAFDALDTDGDAALSQEEIELAVESFARCDLDRNEVVDFLEVEQVAKSRRMLRTPQFDRTALLRLLAADDPGEVDVHVTVDFHTAEPQQSKLTVAAVREGVEVTGPGGRAAAGGDPSAISVSIDGTAVWFSAVQPEGNSAADQVSLGAVDDGYPLLPVLDPDDDGRLTIRELRGLVDRLRRMDRDADGRIAGEELRAPIRVCFGFGPTVHRELAGIRSIGTAESRPTPGPEWFTRMDRNEDGDLSRGEFPGTDQQFAELDKDGDGLISSAEALAGEA